MAASAHALATWKLKLPRRGMSLQPVARFDVLWPVFSENQDRAWMATVGLNWQIAAHVRLMVDFEVTRCDDTLSALWLDGEQVFVQLALDL
jgi:phosphate-selective porin